MLEDCNPHGSAGSRGRLTKLKLSTRVVMEPKSSASPFFSYVAMRVIPWAKAVGASSESHICLAWGVSGVMTASLTTNMAKERIIPTMPPVIALSKNACTR